MKITLYLSKKARRSEKARKAVEELCYKLGHPFDHCEIVDVLEEVQRGIKANLVVTPTLR